MTERVDNLVDRLKAYLRKTLPEFWRRNRWFFLVFVLALVCDTASTIHFMHQQGADGYTLEMHPGIRWAARFLGPIGGPLLGLAGKVAAGLIVGLYLGKWAPYLFVTVTIISFWAAWYNIWGIHLGWYYPNIFNLWPW